jgi:predicted small metal-binding protein
MTTFEISDKNVIMASFDDMQEEVHKAFEECKKAQEEKEMQELLACYAKDRHNSVTQIKEHVLPPIDSTKEV